MRQTTCTKNRAENKTLLAATLACYLLGFACLLALGHSLAVLVTPGLANNVRLTLEREARP